MFGKTDLTKIEELLQRIVANQNKLLACWEDTAKPEAEPIKPKRKPDWRTASTRPSTEERAVVPEVLIEGTAHRRVNIEASILNYFHSKQAKTASTSALLSRFGGFARQVKTGKLLMHGKGTQRLNTNKEILAGLLHLMETRQVAATTGVRLGRLSVLFGLAERMKSENRLSLAKTKAILMTTHPEDLY